MTKNHPLFSVCMVTYNHEDFISKSIESVVKQKHNYTYELLISDDCSQDNTASIIKKYETKYPDIIKANINKTNVGPTQNYFQTLNRCKGKYILFCDGDDCWEQGKVKDQISFLENNKDFGFCYSKMEVIDRTKDNSTYFGYYPEDLKQVLYENPTPSSTMCFKTELWEKYFKQINPIKQRWLLEDYPFIIFCFANSKGYYFSQTLAKYNLISGSLSHPKSLEKAFTYECSIRDVRKYFSDKYKTPVRLKSNYEIYLELTKPLERKFIKNFASEANKLYITQNFNDRKLFLLSKNRFSNHIYRIIPKLVTLLKAILPYGIVRFLQKRK